MFPIGFVNSLWYGMLQCPDATQKAQFIDAVKKGYITWHAGPFNLEPEMAHDAWLFEYGIELSKSLDKRLNVTRNTRVLSQRDVPGNDVLFSSVCRWYIRIKVAFVPELFVLSVYLSYFFPLCCCIASA
jgi:hypothetical protein